MKYVKCSLPRPSGPNLQTRLLTRGKKAQSTKLEKSTKLAIPACPPFPRASLSLATRMYQNAINIIAAFVISFVFGSPLLSLVMAGIMPLLIFAGMIQVCTFRTLWQDHPAQHGLFYGAKRIVPLSVRCGA